MEKLFHLVSGYITLAFKSLVVSGHSSSMFGKYFEAKEVTKHVKNSCAALLSFGPASCYYTAALPAFRLSTMLCFHICFTRTHTRHIHARPSQKQVSCCRAAAFESRNNDATTTTSYFFWLKMDPFRRVHEKIVRNLPKNFKVRLENHVASSFCESDYFQRWFFERVSTIYSIFHVESELIFLF